MRARVWGYNRDIYMRTNNRNNRAKQRANFDKPHRNQLQRPRCNNFDYHRDSNSRAKRDSNSWAKRDSSSQTKCDSNSWLIALQTLYQINDSSLRNCYISLTVLLTVIIVTERSGQTTVVSMTIISGLTALQQASDNRGRMNECYCVTVLFTVIIVAVGNSRLRSMDFALLGLR